MRTVRTLMLAVAAGLLVAQGALAGEMAVSEASDASRPFVVKVHADWCGTCRALNATWDELERELGDGARLVILDVTDAASLAKAQAEARRLGIEGFFAAYKSKTGTIAVLRGDDRATVEVMKGVTDADRYAAAVSEARNPS